MNKVIIIIEGGLVQEVIADGDIEAYVLDRDTNGQIEGAYRINGQSCFIHEPDVTSNKYLAEKISQEINSLPDPSKIVYKLCGADVMHVLNDMEITISPEQMEGLLEFISRKLDIPWAEYIQSTIEYYLYQAR